MLLRAPLVTSGRRFLARGPWRTFFLIVWLLARWTLRLDTERYAERWRGPDSRPPGSAWPEHNGAGNLLRQATHALSRVRATRYK